MLNDLHPHASTASSDLLQKLLRRSEISHHLFASPLHVGSEDAPDLWLPRFSLLGTGRHEHSSLFALLANTGSGDHRATEVALELLDRRSREVSEIFPDLVVYPDLGSSTGPSESDAVPDLLRINWLDSGDRRVAALLREVGDLPFDGFLTIHSSESDLDRPIIQVSGTHLSEIRRFDVRAAFYWQPRFEAEVATDGPLTLGDLLPRRAFELRVEFPRGTASKGRRRQLIQALEGLLIGFSASLVAGHGI